MAGSGDVGRTHWQRQSQQFRESAQQAGQNSQTAKDRHRRPNLGFSWSQVQAGLGITQPDRSGPLIRMKRRFSFPERLSYRIMIMNNVMYSIIQSYYSTKTCNALMLCIAKLNLLCIIIQNNIIFWNYKLERAVIVNLNCDWIRSDVCLYNLKEANALVEEFMLLANITVSKKILRHYPSLSILRRHCPPNREQFLPLEEAALAVGVRIDISSSKTLADSLDAAQRPGDPYFNKLLRILATRCMMPAQYFCSGEVPKEQFHHYGLAAPVYT